MTWTFLEYEDRTTWPPEQQLVLARYELDGKEYLEPVKVKGQYFFEHGGMYLTVGAGMAARQGALRWVPIPEEN